MLMDKILEEIKKAESFVVVAHMSPDGDAIGTCLGVYALLKSLGKSDVDVLYDEFPETFRTLPNSEVVKEDASHEKYDMAIVCDCPNADRVVEKYRKYVETAGVVVEFDHHLNNTLFGNYSIVDPAAPACAEVIIKNLNEANIEINNDMAICFLTGIITDTDGFRFNSVTKDTFAFAGWCLDQGIDVSKIYKDALTTKTLTQFEAERLALNRMEFFYDNKITFTYITNEDKEKMNIKSGELEGIATMGTTIKGVEIAIFAHGKEDGYKMSFRSNRVDVSEICEKFGGGGHKMAAGCIINDNIENVKKMTIDETIKHLK